MSYFWSGYVLKDFIFLNFNTTTIPGFLGVFIALFSVGVLYEALFFLKKRLLQQFLHLRQLSSRRKISVPSTSSTFTGYQRSETDDNPPSTSHTAGGTGSAVISSSDNPRNSLLAEEDEDEEDGGGGGEGGASSSIQQAPAQFPLPPSSYLLVSSILHALYAFIGYTLMNAVMTFNLWVLVAICCGIGLGYLVFRTEYPAHSPHMLRDRGSSPQSNGIETDDPDEDEYQTQNERNYQSQQQQPVKTDKTSQRSSSSASSSTKKSPGSPASGGSSRSSSRRSKNRERAAAYQESLGKELPPVVNGVEPQTEAGATNGPVIVVGAQVHSTYQESV